MGSFTTGSVVLVRFPFSDFSQAKLRPAVVLADCEKGDWLLCQITSNPYADSRAVELADQDFKSGSLRTISYARPSKLFTANQVLISGTVGSLHDATLQKIKQTVIALLGR
jgi:mRNA interferase MazF